MPSILTTRVTEPDITQEPVSLGLLADHLRLDLDSEPTSLLTLYLQAARGYCERYCNRSFAPGQFRGYWDYGHYGRADWRLSIVDPADIVVDGVTVTDPQGEVEILAPEDYVWSPTLSRLYLERGYMYGRIYADYTVVSAICPTAVRNAILLVAGDMYEYRVMQLPGIVYDNETAQQLLRMYRVGLGV